MIPFDLPQPGSASAGRGHGPETASSPKPSPAHQPRYRLEALRANAGPNLFPRVYDTIEEACDYAELSLVVMGPHAAWKMTGYRVKELSSSRVVTSVNWHDPNDPYDQDPFG